MKFFNLTVLIFLNYYLYILLKNQHNYKIKIIYYQINLFKLIKIYDKKDLFFI